MTNQELPELTVGMQLWQAYHDKRNWRRNGLVTVTKVGRKWATLDTDERISLADWREDARGYSSNFTCWPTQAAWQEMIYVVALWREFRNHIDRMSHADIQKLTAADIRAVAARLGIELKLEQEQELQDGR